MASTVTGVNLLYIIMGQWELRQSGDVLDEFLFMLVPYTMDWLCDRS